MAFQGSTAFEIGPPTPLLGPRSLHPASMSSLQGRFGTLRALNTFELAWKPEPRRHVEDSLSIRNDAI